MSTIVTRAGKGSPLTNDEVDANFNNLNSTKLEVGGAITVADNVFTLQDNLDPTKQAQFQLSGFATGTAYTFTLPSATTTLAGLAEGQTFSGATTFSNTTVNVGSATGASTYQLGYGATTTGLTKTVNVGTGGLSGSTTNIAIGSSVSGATSTTTMNGTTNFLDTGFTLQDDADTTKKAQFQLINIPTGTTTTYTLPAGVANAATLIDAQTVQTISGAKTFSGGVTFSAASGSYGTNANASTYNFASGATTTGLTKTVNIGTGGLSGSTTAITIGSTFGTTTNLLGILQLAGSAGTSGQVLTSAGAGAAPTWTAASGSAAGSNTQIQFNNSGAFGASSSFTWDGTTQSAPIQKASNGIVVNSSTVSASYTIASGTNAMSVGPITVASGQAVTVTAGQRWVVL